MLHRRELIAALLGTPLALSGGCGNRSVPASGELLSPNLSVGHRIRDGFRPQADRSRAETAEVIIIGGGIAGLSAAWQLLQQGQEDFIVLELETEAGGTARGQTDVTFPYPWGAHYVPVPMAENASLLKLFSEMGVVESVGPDGSPVVAEQRLCRDPQERVFFQGRWHEGLYPFEDASEQDLQELQEFREAIWRWVDKRDDAGRRYFAVPSSSASDHADAMALDGESMSDWVERHGWTSRRLRWLIDYSCRDDYGLSIEQTSAWAGMFYFASRVRKSGSESQPVITWPEGNGAIVNHLASRCGPQLRCGHAVTQIISPQPDSVEVTAVDTQSERPVLIRGKRVIFAAPQFLASRLIDGLDGADRSSFRYGSWLVANLHLDRRPQDSGFPMCWDNVIYGSKSLGYVTSTHQSCIDHGPTVLTWYYPLTNVDPKIPRKQLLSMSWSEWADVVLTDMEVPHPDIRELVSRLDVMRWGHAMIQPRVGFVSSEAKRRASMPQGPIHFAGTDLSGVALMEEAFDHGTRAADAVLKSLG